MVGGVKYEHTHRMIAEFIGLLIIVMAVWTQRVETRKWMRVLGWTALGRVIGQGILGGITVLNFLPWSISTAHATLGADDLLHGGGDGVVYQSRLAAGLAAHARSRPDAEHADAGRAGRGLRLGAVDSGRGFSPLRNQAAAAPHRRLRGHGNGVLDHRARATRYGMSITCASRRNCCWRC